MQQGPERKSIDIGSLQFIDQFEDSESQDSEEESLPEIDTGDSGDDDDEEEDDESDEARMLRELEEEERMERELAEDEDDDESASNASGFSSESLSQLILRHTFKPDEAVPDNRLINGHLSPAQRGSLLGFDTRDFKDKGRVVISEITGQDKWEWDDIEPDYGSESGEDEVTLFQVPTDLAMTDILGTRSRRIESATFPAHFYDGMPHVGYDIDGKRVMRPAKGDELDKFLATIDGGAWLVLDFPGTPTASLDGDLQDVGRGQDDAAEC